MANIRDLAIARILTAPSPALSGVVWVLEANQGIDMPPVPFNLLAYPEGAMPTKYNSERVLVTARTLDTITVTRAQGGIAAKAVAVGWLVSNNIFVSDLDDLRLAIFNSTYPIGSQYTNYDVATNPGDSTMLGFGTWVAKSDQVVVGKAAAGTFSAPAGTVVGSETQVLTQANLPSGINASVSNPYGTSASIFEVPTGQFSASNSSGKAANLSAIIGGVASTGSTLNWTLGGSGTAHNNIQPSVIAYMWKRTA